MGPTPLIRLIATSCCVSKMVNSPSEGLISLNQRTKMTSVPRALVSVRSLDMPTIERPIRGQFGTGNTRRNTMVGASVGISATEIT